MFNAFDHDAQTLTHKLVAEVITFKLIATVFKAKTRGRLLPFGRNKKGEF